MQVSRNGKQMRFINFISILHEQSGTLYEQVS